MGILLHSNYHQVAQRKNNMTTRGSDVSTTINKSKKLTVEQSRVLEAMAAKLDWSYKPKEGDEKKFIAGSKLPDSVKKLLTQAHNSEQKLATEAIKLLKKIPEDSEIYKKLKSTYTQSQQIIQDIKHISDFKELPNAEVALTQQSFNEEMVKELWLNCFSTSIKFAHCKMFAKTVRSCRNNLPNFK